MLETALLFRNGMVIQRDKPVTVWGTAAPGAAVRVAMQNRTAECTADADGRWKAVCGPFCASFSEEMILSSGGEFYPGTAAYRSIDILPCKRPLPGDIKGDTHLTVAPQNVIDAVQRDLRAAGAKGEIWLDLILGYRLALKVAGPTIGAGLPMVCDIDQIMCGTVWFDRNRAVQSLGNGFQHSGESQGIEFIRIDRGSEQRALFRTIVRTVFIEALVHMI